MCACAFVCVWEGVVRVRARACETARMRALIKCAWSHMPHSQEQENAFAFQQGWVLNIWQGAEPAGTLSG